mgnify:FL=1
MKTSDDLFELIKSLDQAEKRYFKLFASMNIRKGSEDNNYVRLFDFIDKQAANQGKYDEDAVKKHFNNEKFIKQLHVLKGYLYSVILKSLRLYHAEKSKVNELNGLLRDADILFHKSLFGQSKKLIAKAKRIAIVHEKYIQLLEIIDMEKAIARAESYTKRTEEDLDNIYYEVNDSLERIRNINDFWRLSTKSFFLRKKYGNIRNEEELSKFNELMKNPLLKSEDRAATYLSKNFYYNIKGLFYLTKGDYENLLKYSKKLVEFLEANPEMMRPNNYLAALNNLLIVQMETGKYEDAMISIKKIRNISADSKAMSAQIFIISYDNEINLYLLTGDFSSGIKLVPDVERGLKDFSGRIDQESEILFYYNIAYLFFGSGKYEYALEWINKILNKKDLKLREDIQIFARLLNLFVHFELDNYDLLEYEIKSTRRFFDSHNYLNEFEKAILSFLNKIINLNSPEQKEELYNDLKFKLSKKTKDASISRASQYFDTISWLDSKLKNKSFSEIVKVKSQKR